MHKPATLSSYILLLCIISLTSNAAMQTAATGREYAETMLLLSVKDYEVLMGTKASSRHIENNTSRADLVAEITWQACNGKRELKSDTLAWLAKTIGLSKNGRYTKLVEDCLAKVTEKAPIKYFTEAKTALVSDTASNSFVGGTTDLVKLRNDIIRNGKIPPAESIARAYFATLKSAQRLEGVYTNLGAPRELSGVNVTRGKVGFGSFKYKLSDDLIVFHYPGLGEVRFGYDKSADDWLLFDAKSSNDLYWFERDGRFTTKMDGITSGDALILRQITKSLARQPEPIETAVLDRVADRINHSQVDSNGKMADALAHMCKLLGKSNNGKYKQMLLEVSEKAAHRSLSKYAGKAADSLPDNSTERYVPKKLAN